MLLSLYTASSLPPPHHVPIMAVIFSGLGNCKSLTFQFSLPWQPTFHTAAKMNSYCQSTLPPPFNGLPLQLGQGRLSMTCPCYSIQLISCFWYNVLSSESFSLIRSQLSHFTETYPNHSTQSQSPLFSIVVWMCLFWSCKIFLSLSFTSLPPFPECHLRRMTFSELHP